MQDVPVRISLLPGTEDPQITDTGYQNELRGFAHSLEAAGVKVVPRQYMPPMDLGVLYTMLPGFLGEYGLPLSQMGISAIGGALVAWITTRGNRRVRIKIGDNEFEARTPEEVEKLLQLAKSFRQELDAAKKSAGD